MIGSSLKVQPAALILSSIYPLITQILINCKPLPPVYQSHNYNLRVRKQNQSFNGFDKKESADDFGKLVSKLAKDNRRCRKSLIGSLTESSTQNNKKMHVISEDDE